MDNVERVLDSILSVTCNILHVSPLSIGVSKTDQKVLAKKLEEHLQQRTKEDAYFQVQVEFINHPLKQSPFESNPLLIQIYKTKAKKDGETRKLVNRVLFSGYNTNGHGIRYFGTPIQNGANSSLLNLPVVIWHGKSKVWEDIRKILESLLHVSFSPVHFSSIHLQMFTGIWLYQQIKRGLIETSSDEVKLEYALPLSGNQANQDPNIGFTVLNFTEWKKSLLELEDELNDIRKLKYHLMRIWEEVLRDYKNSLNIDLTRSPILKIGTNSCVITSKGRMKLRKGSKLEEILPILNQVTRILELQS